MKYKVKHNSPNT